uniref:Complex 1 LYR protein domain-containing protein n=1 Tax=Vannella robusta TaxID=1487602 RepID=A0A7S4IVA8_9EUKA|mmetsp:Transcript_9271/g.11474  ORF Transcript_9271/g.11474 Transcript_9271/m.11474 type:complete len:103 (+) Transcript_9271:98-406(+)
MLKVSRSFVCFRLFSRGLCSVKVQTTRQDALALYKQFMIVGRDYPDGLDKVRKRAKRMFLSNKDETDPQKLQEAFDRGNYMLEEMISTIQFHKYRALRKSYG